MLKKYIILPILVMITFCIMLIFLLIQRFDFAPNENIVVNNSNNPVEIVITSSWGGSDAYADTLVYLLNKFMEKNSAVRVVNQSVFGDDFINKLKTDFASGNDPDVFGIWPGSVIKNLIYYEKVADLTDVLLSDIDWFIQYSNKALFDYTSKNDKIYGIPFELSVEGLFINNDIYKKFNLKPPETFDQLIYNIKVLKRHNIIPIAYNAQAEGSFIYQNIVAAIGDKYAVSNPFSNGKVHNCFLHGMEYMKYLYNLGAFPKNFFNLSSKQRNDLFLNKKAAMIVQGSWFLSKCDPKTVTFVRFPSFPAHKSKKTIIFGLGGGTFYISKKAFDDPIKKPWAIKLLKYLTTYESAVVFFKQCSMLTNIELQAQNKNPLYIQIMNEMIASEEYIDPPDHFIDRAVWEDVIIKKFPYVLEGRITPQDIWNEAYKRIYGK